MLLRAERWVWKVGSQSIQAAVDWNRDSRPVCAEMRAAPRRPRTRVRHLVYRCDECSFLRGVVSMSLADARTDATVEECLDELNDFIMGLERYAPTVLA